MLGIIFKVLGCAYGTFMALILSLLANINGNFIAPPSKRFLEHVKTQRDELWNLSNPIDLVNGYRSYHDFVRLSTGAVLHYLTTHSPSSPLAPSSTGRQRNLIIFLHGWPDSCHIWTKVFQTLLTSDGDSRNGSVLVALDLPGFGGSSNLTSYDPGHVLDAVAESIHTMRKKYFEDGSKGRTVLVSHDWGATITGRLAVEAPEVADHFILVNGPILRHFQDNIMARIKSAKGKLMRFNVVSAWADISLLLGQLLKSYYVFVFNLPGVLSQTLLPFAFWSGQRFFIRSVTRLAIQGQIPGYMLGHVPKDEAATVEEMAEHLASVLGPGEEALTSVLEEKAYASNGGVGWYGRDVTERVRCHGGWGNVETESLRYYRDGLAFLRWKPSKSVSALLDEMRESEPPLKAKTRLRKPVTIVWGCQDAALDWRLLVAGVEEWSGGMARIRWVEKCGHWVVSQEGTGGAEIVMEEIEQALSAK